MKVGVIDYGVGNLGSVMRALELLRVAPLLINRPSDLRAADCLILPGVGNFADCVRMLESGHWIGALKEAVVGYNRPLLGVCVGMQLLADSSTEGSDNDEPIAGLGFVPGQVKHLGALGCQLRVPHAGWNAVTSGQSNDHLFHEIPPETDFYFVHSYAFQVQNATDVIATTDYGITVTAAVRRGHVWGTQFHPEKSSKAGFKVLKNFIEGPSC
ncbi:imidazole glycerol phosphate synthase subunit HisH [Limnohabitans sp. 15K]|uniref:imidazole glycerol phosphate synthase subunit HisH n=1 Tax=Limnohabitans sp. 15K TaxID=1100706 RepID=UPI000C1F65DA|nr:imidazole glycerol phosphate synthase subunit HisH [Limnohabitans sp. 15K]PIT82073.1 imidazole glycerol phosphate synthase subunit HisH [Limnohabitans sp. 15K]